MSCSTVLVYWIVSNTSHNPTGRHLRKNVIHLKYVSAYYLLFSYACLEKSIITYTDEDRPKARAFAVIKHKAMLTLRKQKLQVAVLSTSWWMVKRKFWFIFLCKALELTFFFPTQKYKFRPDPQDLSRHILCCLLSSLQRQSCFLCYPVLLFAILYAVGKEVKPQ